ncbi:antibiotic biosynthesis monooxygenase [Dyadobacter sp. CY107]|uniref:antibiotic biosynthesis monooxygenase n=1 Tax=Dyadobacter fanqingshengii TaxID=2906443 RepID=UPI001F234EFC|nr:antibiotic biosynthesis monooxygenase [Dyadobacter fanqingshengii]MCF2503790.1 antibiotic biosynthesis monooxygenase [Dyadobacter fanqingshengii]
MPIHVAITRKVLPGKEEEFKDALRRFLGDSFLHGGVHGAAMMTALPGSESREIGILRTFADQAERDAFYNSTLFKDWEAYASTLTEEPVYRELTGLEAWFRSPVPPPRWKMAVATLCGVYPTSLLLSYLLGPHIQELHPALRTFIIAGCMVPMLTWIVMPQVTKVFKPWLSGIPSSNKKRDDNGTAPTKPSEVVT